MSRQQIIRTARASVLTLIIIALSVFVAFEFVTKHESTALAAQTPAADLGPALYRACLDPESLCAAGLSANDVTALVQNADAHLVDNLSQLNQADQNYATAKTNRDELVRIVRAGTATQQQITDCQTAMTTLTSATSTRDTALDALVTAATASLTTEQRALLTTIRANQDWKLPVEFCAADRTEATWVTLRDALAAERYAQETSEELDPTVTQFLTTQRAVTAVANAISSLDTNLANVQTAWDNAVNN